MDQRDYQKIYDQYKRQGEEQLRNEMEPNGWQQSIPDGKEAFAAVKKNEDGDIIAFKTNTGRELDYVSALEEAKAGKIAHVDVFHKYGREIIRSEPDGIKENNLDQLPEF